MILSQYKKTNEDFIEEDFYAFSKNVLTKLLLGITLDKLDKIDHFVNDSVYNNCLKRLEENKSRKIIEMFDELNTNGAKITNVEVLENKTIITVTIETKYLHYFIDINTREYVSGDNNVREEHLYTLTFEINNDIEECITAHCPSCGMTMDINNSGKCTYCGTIYNQEEKGFVLTQIKRD